MRSLGILSSTHFSTPNDDKDILYLIYKEIATRRAEKLQESEGLCLQNNSSYACSQNIKSLLYVVMTALITDERNNLKSSSSTLNKIYKKADLYAGDLDFFSNIEIGVHEAAEAIGKLIDIYLFLFVDIFKFSPEVEKTLLHIRPLLLDLASMNGALFGRATDILRNLDERHIKHYFSLTSGGDLCCTPLFLNTVGRNVPSATSYAVGNTSTSGCPFLKGKKFAKNLFALLMRSVPE